MFSNASKRLLQLCFAKGKIKMKKTWIYEKFSGDLAIYAFCPECGFHYMCGERGKMENR